MRRLAVLTAIVTATLSTASCSLVTTRDDGPCPDGAVCVNGVVRHFTLEGGFWAVRGDDSTTYDPIDGLPAAYQVDGLRVRLTARVRTDVGSFHMAGPVVDVLDLRRL